MRSFFVLEGVESIETPAQRSEGLGVRLSYFLGSFLEDAINAAKEAAAHPDLYKLWKPVEDVNDPNFHDIAPVMSYGPKAKGFGITCPRDGEPDCSIVDALDKEGLAGEATRSTDARH